MHAIVTVYRDDGTVYGTFKRAIESKVVGSAGKERDALATAANLRPTATGRYFDIGAAVDPSGQTDGHNVKIEITESQAPAPRAPRTTAVPAKRAAWI